jgi:S1-C subfamily serine protease
MVFASRFGVSIMPFVRAVAALVAAVVLCSTAALAETMPVMPEGGKDTTATLPALPGMANKGEGPGGVDAARMEKTLRAAQTGAPPVLRGQAEQNLFNTYARSVVLIVTEDALGSGSVINTDGTILTNAHVVAGYKSVGVIFKPMKLGAEPRGSDAVKATVVRIDEVADLALIKVASLPSDIKPLVIGDFSKVQIGQDVHAIGHPFGETWSYTKGIVSQVRVNYEWKSVEDGLMHKADVVQTQTPINPGNSGGPLLNDAGEMVGVNAFGVAQGVEINFAIAPTDVRRVLAMTSDRMASKAQTAETSSKKKGGACEPVKTSSKRTKKDDGVIVTFDTDCNGKTDTALFLPDSKTDAIVMAVDLNENGKIDVMYVDKDQDLKFDIALYDTNEDGKTDLVGYELNDDLEPGRVELPKA